jgi:GT2 family glycosyltransferase
MLITSSIVLYHNDPMILKNTIESFLNTKLSIKLFLIDNSSDNNLDMFHDTRIEYYNTEKNSGFGAAHNIALSKAYQLNSNYHLILNPDVYFEPGTLENIFNFMELNPTIGHLMPKVLYPDNTFQYLCKTNPTFFDLFARGFLPTFLKNILESRMNKYEYRNHNLNEIIYDIPYLSGCFMFFRCHTLKQVGFFDERIFMYLEDADMTRRILQISQTVYFPNATIFHHYAGLTHKHWKYKWITIKSAFIYFNKWGWLKSII